MARFLCGRFGPGPNPKECENLLQDSQNKSSVSSLDGNIDILSPLTLDFYHSSCGEIWKKKKFTVQIKVFCAFNVRTNHFYAKHIIAVLDCRPSRTGNTPTHTEAPSCLPCATIH